MERVRTLVLIQSKITHDVVGIGAQFVGEISDAIIVAEGNEKIDVLKQNYYLNNEFDDLKHQKIEYRVEKPDKNVHSRYCGLLYIWHDFLPVSSESCIRLSSESHYAMKMLQLALLNPAFGGSA
jgi:hypothetical protein